MDNEFSLEHHMLHKGINYSLAIKIIAETNLMDDSFQIKAAQPCCRILKAMVVLLSNAVLSLSCIFKQHEDLKFT